MDFAKYDKEDNLYLDILNASYAFDIDMDVLMYKLMRKMSGYKDATATLKRELYNVCLDYLSCKRKYDFAGLIDNV